MSTRNYTSGSAGRGLQQGEHASALPPAVIKGCDSLGAASEYSSAALCACLVFLLVSVGCFGWYWLVSQLEAGRAVAQTAAPATKPAIRRILPLTRFYDTPNPLPAGKPGELIRSESFKDYALPPAVSAVRILYHSRSATGENVAASGVVLFPEDETPPAGGWPVIAWGARIQSCRPPVCTVPDEGPVLRLVPIHVRRTGLCRGCNRLHRIGNKFQECIFGHAV